MELTDDDRAAAREVALVWGYKEMCDDRYIGIANDSYLAGKRSGTLEEVVRIVCRHRRRITPSENALVRSGM